MITIIIIIVILVIIIHVTDALLAPYLTDIIKKAYHFNWIQRKNLRYSFFFSKKQQRQKQWMSTDLANPHRLKIIVFWKKMWLLKWVNIDSH